jgi:spore germination protein KC
MQRHTVAVLLVTLLLLTGCWDRIETNDLGVAVGMGVDVGEEERVRLTLYVARTGTGAGGGQQGGGAGQQPVWLASREGENLADALRFIAQAAPRRITLHHVRVILISEAVARAGVEEALDFLIRHPQIRLTSRIMVVPGRTSEVFEVKPNLEEHMPENVVDILPARGGPDQRLKEVLVSRVGHTRSSWMEELKIVDRRVARGDEPKREVEMAGAALFRKDHMVDRLSIKEARALNWLLRSPREAVVTATCPEQAEETFSVEVREGDARITPYLEGDQLRFTVHLDGRGDLVRHACKGGALDPAFTRRLEAALSDDLVERVAPVIEKLQATGVDPVGFGKRVELRYPGYWQRISRDWEEMWPTVQVRTTAELTIAHSGLLLQSASKAEEEITND